MDELELTVVLQHEEELMWVRVERSPRPHSPVILGIGHGALEDALEDSPEDFAWLSRDEARRIGEALITLAEEES
jgi:hypothetical protein